MDDFDRDITRVFKLTQVALHGAARLAERAHEPGDGDVGGAARAVLAVAVSASACARSGARHPSGWGRPRSARPSPAHRRRCRAAVPARAFGSAGRWQDRSDRCRRSSSLAQRGRGGSLFDADAVAGHPRGEALHDRFNRWRSSVDIEVHGFLLGYEKTRQISGRKKPLAKSACVFFGFCQSRDCTDRCTSSFSFYKARLLAGFLFVTSLDFLRTVVNTEMAGLRNRMGHGKSV